MLQKYMSSGYNLEDPAYIDANRMGRITSAQRDVFDSNLSIIPSLFTAPPEAKPWLTSKP
ncbi:MAG: hypothetical protein U9Q82_00855 [Chloroflexota bacterium]|nr:hypothetical protein [Chloroflexota bacterium]